MNRKKSTAIICTTVTFVLLLVTALFVINADTRFKIRKGPVIATEISFYYLRHDHSHASPFSDWFDDYFTVNKINTAIITVNNRENALIDIPGFYNVNISREEYSQKDYITQLKKQFSKNKIQLFVAVDCDELDENKILDTIVFLDKNYKLAAIVLDNYTHSPQTVELLSQQISRKTDIILKTGNEELAVLSDIQGVDGYICEDMNHSQYVRFTSEKDVPVYLHCDSPSLESDIFMLTNFDKFRGAVISQYDGTYEKLTNIIFARNKKKSLPKFGMNVTGDFSVTYPEKDMATYYSAIFITGCGADTTVNVNGAEFPAATDGTFGVYYELAEGDNKITVSSGNDSKTLTVTRKVYSYSGSSIQKEIPWDDTVKLNPGRIVRTFSPLTSLLKDPADDTSISAGIEQGVKLAVKETVEVKRGNNMTHAYKLADDSYILASNVEVLDEITADYQPNKKENTDKYSVYNTPHITSAEYSDLENGDGIFTFYVNNMPAVIHNSNGNQLSLLFMDTVCDEIKIPSSDFIRNSTVTNTEKGAEITFDIDTNNRILWGYDVKTEEGKVTLYLNNAPRHTDSDKPLENVTVVLDPGHGGKDPGALGVASLNGPVEKDLNLAVAKATKSILESYGANVVMTREGDTFPELEDRRSLTREIKPDLFISIHHNSMDYSYNSSTVRGSECYYFTDSSKNLAKLMAQNISTATERKNRGAHKARYYVTRNDICPAVLMEYGFVINPQEYSRLYTDEDIYKAAYGTAMAVYNAIPNYN